MSKMKIVVLSILTYLMVMPSPLVSQEAIDTDLEIGEKDSLVWDNSILPVAFYLPETSFAAGATGILSFKKSSQAEEERPSQLLFAAIYTLRNQLEILGTFEFYANQRKRRCFKVVLFHCFYIFSSTLYCRLYSGCRLSRYDSTCIQRGTRQNSS